MAYTKSIYKTLNNDGDWSHWQELRHIINDTPYQGLPFVITGELGLWDGRHTILPVKIYGLFNAFEKCYGDSINEIEIVQENGHFNVAAHHHDGTNNFVIYLLNDKGECSENGDLTNKRYHKAMSKEWWKC